jgi:hypothetical protein
MIPREVPVPLAPPTVKVTSVVALVLRTMPLLLKALVLGGVFANQAR